MANDTKIRITADTAQAESALRALDSGVNSLASSVVGTLAGALSVGAFAAWIKSSIDAADAVNDLSAKTGIAVETLSTYKLLAEQNGTTVEGMANGMKNLSMAMSQHPEYFARIGVSIRDAQGEMRGMDDVLKDVADKFASYKDGPEKVAAAQDLLGKSGMDLIPVLNQGAAGFEEAEANAKRYGLTLQREVAAAADAFNDKMALAGAQTSAFGTEISGAMLPALNSVAEAFIEFRQGGEQAALVGEGLSLGVKALASVLFGLYGAATMTGKALGGFIALAQEVISGDWVHGKSNFKAVLNEMAADLDAQAQKVGATINKLWEESAQPLPMANTNKPREGVAAPKISGSSKNTQEDKTDAIISKEQEKYQKLLEMATEYNASAADKVTMKLEFDLEAMQREHDQNIEKVGQNQKLDEIYQASRVERQRLAEQELQKIREEAVKKEEADALRKMRSEQSVANFSKLLRRGDFTDAMGMAQQMTAGLSTHSRAAFEVNKAASLAKTTVSGIEMIQKAATYGSEWGGYAGAIAEGALAAVYVAAQLDAINSTQFGGGGVSAPSSGGGVPSQSTSPGVPVTQTPEQQSTQPTVINIYNTGNVLSQDYVENTIIPQIQSAVNNSDVLLIDPRSRQAAALGA